MDKFKVISLLQLNMPPKEIAEKLDVSYGGVLKFKREYESAVADGTVDKLIDTDKVLLLEAAKNVGVDDEVVGELVDKLNGLERLTSEFQQTASKLNTRVNALLLGTNHLSDLETAADILCKLQNAFLNKNTTSVNVQNNFGESTTPKYNKFLSDTPGGGGV